MQKPIVGGWARLAEKIIILKEQRSIRIKEIFKYHLKTSLSTYLPLFQQQIYISAVL